MGDIKKSLWFWRDICRFAALFDRPDEGFAYRDLGGAQIMLGEIVKTRDWVTASRETPFGRGVNFQVRVPEIESVLVALGQANWPLFMAP